MKKTELCRRLRGYNWSLEREGSSHEVWTNGKGSQTTVPRHREINENTARSILKVAKENPG